MTKTIKGSVDYTVELSDTEYSISYTQTPENEMVAAMICKEVLKYSKENLIKSQKQAKGKDLAMIKDRLRKVVASDILLTMICNSVAAELLYPPEPVKEDLKSEPIKEEE